MGGILPVGLKFGDEQALVCDLPLYTRNSLFSFRQTFLKGGPIHNDTAAGRHQRGPSLSVSCS